MRECLRRWHRVVDAIETRKDVLVVPEQRLQINAIKTEWMHDGLATTVSNACQMLALVFPYSRNTKA